MKWQKYLGFLDQSLKDGMEIRIHGIENWNKKNLGKLDGTDKHCGMHDLTLANRVEQMELRTQLNRLMKQEESKWKQRA